MDLNIGVGRHSGSCWFCPIRDNALIGNDAVATDAALFRLIRLSRPGRAWCWGSFNEDDTISLSKISAIIKKYTSLKQSILIGHPENLLAIRNAVIDYGQELDISIAEFDQNSAVIHLNVSYIRTHDFYLNAYLGYCTKYLKLFMRFIEKKASVKLIAEDVLNNRVVATG